MLVSHSKSDMLDCVYNVLQSANAFSLKSCLRPAVLWNCISCSDGFLFVTPQFDSQLSELRFYRRLALCFFLQKLVSLEIFY